MLQEVKNDIIENLGLDQQNDLLDLLVDGSSRYIKDIKLNFKTALDVDHMTAKEAHLTGLAIAVNNKSSKLISFFQKKCTELEATEAEIAEVIACASLLSANNIFYRFRHFVDSDKYDSIPAKIRMNIMAKPVLGKEFFELISLAVSAANGCEMCVKSHEKSVKSFGSGEQRIFDAIRIASVVTSIDKLLL